MDVIELRNSVTAARRVDAASLTAIPFDVTAGRLQALPSAKDAPIVLYCMSGRMSEVAATTLVRLGYTNVKSLRGGMVAWRQAGLPLTTR